MKIFLISNLYPSIKDPDYGIFVKNIEDELVEIGAEITHKAVISGRAKSAYDKLKKYKKFYSQIISAYRKNDFDLVYVHFISHSSPGLLLAKYLCGKKKKWAINVHGSDVLTHNENILKWCNHEVLGETDLLVVPSSYFQDIISNVFPSFPNGKIFVSPSGGINFNVFNWQNVPDNKILHLGFVSRIEDDKGWRTFLEATKILKEKNIPFRGSIAGTGSKAGEMNNLIHKYGLEKSINYLNILSHKELNILYNSLDLFIFPTNRDSESLGLVGLEAMACGVPVVGSEIAGLKTFIEDNRNGFFFTPGDEGELANKIQIFYHMGQIERSTMKQAAIKTAKKYDRKKVAHDLYSKFEQLLS